MSHKHRPAKHFEGLDATLITITGLLILLVFALASPPPSSAGGNAKGKIAFARGSGTAEEIYLMNADGSAQTRVTNNTVRDYFPVISPNGAKIAFESERNGNRDIYVIDPDGTNEQRLTTVPGVDLHPAWSPDGKQIAFSSDQNGNRDIYVINANGTNQQRKTIDPGADLHPVYSPDGTKFAFASERDGDREICLIEVGVTETQPDPDSPGEVVLLTRNKAFDSFPAWTPDGTNLVFHSNRDGNFEIYTMNADGRNQTNITRSLTEDIFPNWSPDGTKIVFESLRGGNRDIYVMDATGNNPTRLTTDAAPDLIPSWHWERTGTVKTISGRVLGISGGAVSDLKINVRRIFDAPANCATNNTFVRTLTDGTYSIQVTPGCAYEVEPDSDELKRLFGQNGIAIPSSITVFVAFNVPAVNFVAGLIPTPSITGRIIDASKCPNYNPAQDANLECGLPGVTVTGEWAGETRTDVSKPINTDPSVSGKYTLPNFLTNSVVRVRAFLPGYVITIIPPNTEQITLTSVTRPLVDFKAVPANSGPAVSLTDPANGTTFPAAPQISINANASDADGSVSKVEFFQGNTKLGEDSSGPYSFTWNGVAPGNYSLTAVATDNGGASTTSSPVNITVNEPPIQFSSATYDVAEGGVTASVIVSRSGDTSRSATVNFTTGDAAGLVNCNVPNTGAASSRCDYETTVGTLRFAANEISKTISVPVIDDSYAEGIESFTVTLSNATGATLGLPSTATVTITDNDTANGTNPINQAGFFVRLHYIDFLNREPDASGLAFWSDQITSCGTDTACIELRRINVSAAFFISIEFQETGYLVYRIYKAAHGNLTNAPVPVRFSEFLPDTQQIGQGVVVGQPGAEQVLENNKIAFAAEFVARQRFTTAYPTTRTPTQFVDTLFTNAGVTPPATERDALINEFGMATNTSDAAARARVLRRVAEHSLLGQLEFNKAFVLMQYFGYLRRNPNDPPETTLDFQGYNFWLGKLNQFNGNFINAEMVKAFIVSGEYKQRFGP